VADENIGKDLDWLCNGPTNP